MPTDKPIVIVSYTKYEGFTLMSIYGRFPECVYIVNSEYDWIWMKF